MGVFQLGNGLGFLLKTAGVVLVGPERLIDHLNGNPAFEAHIQRPVDASHAAMAQQLIQAIFVEAPPD
jgi:hypothetical protein